jgi:hypothetical protein
MDWRPPVFAKAMVRQGWIAALICPRRESYYPVEDDWALRETTAVCRHSARNERHGVRLQADPAARRGPSRPMVVD